MPNKAQHPKADFIRALRQDSRDWWHHANLRRDGRIVDARKKENASVASKIEAIRLARQYNGILVISDFGTLFRYHPNVRSSGLHKHYIEAVQMAGIVTIDLRDMPNKDAVGYALSTPILSLEVKEDEAGFHSLSYVTPSTYIAIARAWGAKIINDTGAPLPPNIRKGVLPEGTI